MTKKIDRDVKRFKDIVRKKVREDLGRHIQQGDFLGRQGKKTVSIPMPSLDLPRFRYGTNQSGGVGQGEGEKGTPIGKDGESGPGEAGEAIGEHVLETEFELEEIANILGEKLELERKDRGDMPSEKITYRGAARVGPENLRIFKRTFKEALKRQIGSGTYNPDNPIVVPRREDKRFRSFRREPKPDSKAVIVYMMDVSGSMGYEQKRFTRNTAGYISMWLRHGGKKRGQYGKWGGGFSGGLEEVWIIHDAQAKRVDEHTFFHTRESGGTKISTAYELAAKIQKKEFPANEYNIYFFHFSDGDNWGGSDTSKALEIVKNEFLPVANIFGYCQTKSAHGSGQFLDDVLGRFPDEPRVNTALIQEDEDIIYALESLLMTPKQKAA